MRAVGKHEPSDFDAPTPRRWSTCYAGLAAFSLVLSGCATVQSDARRPGQAPTVSSGGVTYFLPRKLVKLTATRDAIDIDKLVEARDAKAKALADAQATYKAAQKASATAQAILDEIAADGSGRAQQVAAVTLRKAEEAVAAKSVPIAAAAHAAAVDEVRKARAGEGGCAYDAKLEALPVQPDMNHQFVARLRHNWMRDDTVKLKVTAAGLLTSANVVAADRTGDIIVEAAGAFAALGGLGPKSTAFSLAAAPEGCQLKVFTQILDPSDGVGVTGVSDALEAAGFPFRVRATAAVAETRSSELDVAAALSARRQGALFYRSSAPVTLSLQRKDAAGNWYMADAAIVMTPQAGPIGFIPTNSSVFVKTVDDVQFVEGSIAGWDTDRPSEVLEVVRLPVKVATAIISVPAQLLSLKVDYSSKSKSLAEAQKAEIETQKSLLKLKTCLASAQASGTTGDACIGAAN